MLFQSINPYNKQLLAEFPTHDSAQVEQRLAQAQQSFRAWAQMSFAQRGELLDRVKNALLTQKEQLAALITAEMGKPISQAIAEIEKCATVCDYYRTEAERILQTETLTLQPLKARILYQPLGQILLIMPWNFPFWQVFRFASAALMAGNVVVLKHAPNVQLCAEAIERLFFEQSQMQLVSNLRLSNEQTSQLIQHELIKAVSITGSNKAGASVAQNAGLSLKKSVLELGGNDAAIVCADADLSQTVEQLLWSRLQNSGQTCIATKRIFVQKRIFDQFAQRALDYLPTQTLGDPSLPTTKISCLARPDLLDNLENQVNKSLQMGASYLYKGGRLADSNFFSPVLLQNAPLNSPMFREEIFGCAAAIFPFENEEEALHLANDSIYGLGASVWSADLEKAQYLAERLEVGAVAINQLLKSDARLPFGGVKASGYGRELGEQGIKEFVNIKTVCF